MFIFSFHKRLIIAPELFFQIVFWGLFFQIIFLLPQICLIGFLRVAVVCAFSSFHARLYQGGHAARYRYFQTLWLPAYPSANAPKRLSV
jgi:hypothetical protein